MRTNKTNFVIRITKKIGKENWEEKSNFYECKDISH